MGSAMQLLNQKHETSVFLCLRGDNKRKKGVMDDRQFETAGVKRPRQRKTY